MGDFFYIHTRRCKHGSEESDETLVKKARCKNEKSSL